MKPLTHIMGYKSIYLNLSKKVKGFYILRFQIQTVNQPNMCILICYFMCYNKLFKK